MKIILSLVVLVAFLLFLARTKPTAMTSIITMLIGAVVAGLIKLPLVSFFLIVIAIAVAATGLPAIRTKWLSQQVFDIFKQISPKVSPTEQIALDAGTVGWDGVLFSGRPEWDEFLQATPLLF